MAHLCAVCQKEDWHKLDVVLITCPKCLGKKVIKTGEGENDKAACDMCAEKGMVNFVMRDRAYWFDRNIIYDEAVGMKVCKQCGFVTYEPRWSEEVQRERYTKERSAVSASHIIKSNIKNAFHKFFLELDKNNFEIVLDIGCAFGHIRQIFPKSDIYGIEYASRFANYAKRVNMISVMDKIGDVRDNSIDLVMAYHTLEHVSDPRAELLEARRVLKKDGRLYIAVPDYFGPLREVSGQACLDFEQLYHLNHNNVFSHTSLHNLLKQCGFEVIKSDNQYYGEAVLCKVNDEIDKTIAIEDYRMIEGKLVRQRAAIEILSKTYKSHDSEQAEMGIEAALAQYPSYVDAYEAYMVQKSKYKDVKAVRELYNRACATGCDTIHLRDRFANILINWCDAGQVNNFVKLAVELMSRSLTFNPGDIDAHMNLCKVYAYNYNDYEKANYHAEEALKLNPGVWAEVQNVISQMGCIE
jgi:SAM-dependent methyltransferase